eukprot:CFRG6164T1
MNGNNDLSSNHSKSSKAESLKNVSLKKTENTDSLMEGERRISKNRTTERVVDGIDIAFDPSGGMWSGNADGGESSIDHVSIEALHDAHDIPLIGMAWEDLNFSVTVGGGLFKKNQAKEKKILHDVSGHVEPGSMLAIMGASGAGKTTLLNLLAGRLTSSGDCKTEGRIYVNGKKRNYAQFKKYSAYVMQDDDMFAEMTVKETITFSAVLRLPSVVDKKETALRVNKILAELGLNHVAESYIGNNILRGVSGGERKRVNIGMELVTDPSLIFLDEPTSGLDSFNALNVIYTMRRLCTNNRTIVTTIHQPRSNIYAMFDNLLLLSQGRVVYFGPAQDAVTYFSKLDFNAPTHFNPADYFIDLLSVDSRTEDTTRVCKKRVEFLSDYYHQNVAKESTKRMSAIIRKKQLSKDEVTTVDANTNKREMKTYQKTWGFELYILCKRSMILMLREKQSNTARVMQTLFFAILLGLLWLNQGRDYNDDPSNVTIAQNLLGIFFFMIVNISFGSVFGVLFVYPLERSIVLRERASGSYRVSSYYLAKTITELPRNMIIVMINCVIVYWMVGLASDVGSFLFFYLVLLLAVVVAESITICVSTLTPDPQTASAIIPVFIVLSMLFSGFLIGSGSIPDYLIWLEYLSYIKYGFQALSNQQLASSIPTAGSMLIEQQGLDDLNEWTCIGILFAMYFVLRLLCYFILRMNGPKYDHTL